MTELYAVQDTMNLVPPTNDRHTRLVTDPPREPYRFKLETWLEVAQAWGPDKADELCDMPPRDAA